MSYKTLLLGQHHHSQGDGAPGLAQSERINLVVELDRHVFRFRFFPANEHSRDAHPLERFLIAGMSWFG